MQRTWLALLTGAGLACGGAAARPAALEPAPRAGSSRASSLDAGLAEDMARDQAIPWSPSWRLKWADFKGPPPTSGKEGARTAHGIYSAWSCRGNAFAFRVRAAFLPTGSWVKPIVLREGNESARVLRHEQAHFDLSEVYARRLRRRMAALPSPCTLKDGELGALVHQHIEEEKAAQRRYDEETDHSLRTERQEAWERQVARWLAELARYAP
jgi:hypothetical protein